MKQICLNNRMGREKFPCHKYFASLFGAMGFRRIRYSTKQSVVKPILN